ncbi:MAG: extensin family protein, partial [Myxococcales bacterium]|nr:extensin family protein [Myxococcales bacterium]
DDSLLTVEEHWEKLVDAPVTPEGQWLKALADARYAQMIFHIILTPNYNDAHYNHFHVDLTPGSMFYE